MAELAQQDPLIGAIFEDRYRVISQLGKGGMGNVYLAEEVRLRRRCALKVLHPELGQERAHVERFLREAQTMAQLSHPNIVSIFAYGEDRAGVFFIMELLAGEDLDSRIRAREQRPFGLEDCCRWAIQLARAVGVVHKAGLIHRDLKTSNVFLAEQDGEHTVKLLDFGIARPAEGSELTGTGVALGTPSYMSPEQVLNEPIDHRSDVYSFGVLLFKMLTGRLPFQGTPIQVTTQHCMSPPPSPSSVAPGAKIWPDLDAIVLKAMEKQRERRFQSMLEIEQCLLVTLEERAAGRASALRRGRPVTQYGLDRGPTGRLLALGIPDAGVSRGEDQATPAGEDSLTGPTTVLPDRRSKAGSRRRIALLAGVAGFAVIGALAVVMLPAGEQPAALPQLPPEAPAPGPVADPSPSPPALAVEAAGGMPGVDTPEAPSTVEQPSPEPSDPGGDAVAPPEEAPEQPVKKRPASKVSPRKATDPFARINREAEACRRKYNLEKGAKITIDYAIGLDGSVTRSVPSEHGPLARCLAEAVRSAVFPPRSKPDLNKKISL